MGFDYSKAVGPSAVWLSVAKRAFKGLCWITKNHPARCPSSRTVRVYALFEPTTAVCLPTRTSLRVRATLMYWFLSFVNYIIYIYIYTYSNHYWLWAALNYFRINWLVRRACVTRVYVTLLDHCGPRPWCIIIHHLQCWLCVQVNNFFQDILERIQQHCQKTFRRVIVLLFFPFQTNVLRSDYLPMKWCISFF